MEKLKILILEDNKNDFELIKLELKRKKFNFECKHVDTKDPFIKELKNYKADIILSDYNLPQFTGFEALELSKEYTPKTPFIIVTGTLNEETAAESIKKGAWDYVVKERLFRLEGAIKNSLKLKKQIDEKEKTEKKLIENEKDYRLLFENAPIGISIASLDGIIIKANNSFTKITGFSEKELLEINIFDITYKPEHKDIQKTTMKKVIEDKVTNHQGEVKLINKNNKIIDVFIQTIIHKDSKGNPLHFISFVEDITERKNYEKNIFEAKEKAVESDRLKSVFLKTISHELRTPLNAVIGFSDLLNDTLPGETINEFTEMINTSGNNLLNIVENIFETSMIESGEEKIQTTTFFIYDIFNNIEAIIKAEQKKAKKEHLKLIYKPNSSKIKIKSDFEKLSKAIILLIQNAIKFTEEGIIEYGFNIKNNNELVIFVKDTGIGIPKEKHNLIFEYFRQIEDTDTRRYEGVGIGLTLAKDITQLLKGEIWLISEKKKGSTFFISIPFDKTIEKPKEAKSKKIDISNISLTNKKILIAEDEETNYILLKTILSVEGAKSTWAVNGIEAVQLTKENDYDLILMDIKMPMLNGIEATKQIKKIKAHINIIAITAFTNKLDIDTITNAGCDAYIKKPFNKKSLIETIKKNINNPRQ
ncbi:MAG: response regulator [Bacteroidota bacterium]|nr:response regulator [Bacteroidota bacterium]